MARGKVLLVDANAIERGALAVKLRHAGYEVVAAGDGQAALAQLRLPPPPCAILLSAAANGTQGRDLLAQLRQDPAAPPVPIFVLADGNAAPAWAAEAGVSDWLPKPINIDRLLAALGRLC